MVLTFAATGRVTGAMMVFPEVSNIEEVKWPGRRA
jgi:hypothetical protein